MSLNSVRRRVQLAALATALPLLTAAPALASSDGRPRHALSVGLGLRADAVREDLLVPVAFAGPGLRLLVAYEGVLGPGLLSGRADFGTAYLQNRWGHDGVTIDYGAQLAWTTRVLGEADWHLAAGLVAALDSRVNYLFSWDDAHLYWLGSQWLGPTVRHGRRLNENWTLDSTFSLAVLGFEGRPPSYRYTKQEAAPNPSIFFTSPHRSERFVTLTDLQVVRLDVSVRRDAYASSAPGRGWSFGLDLRFVRTDIAATNINLSACAYASRAWSW